MKIRTDFVTNSSSSSWGEVIIDNPILLKILKKYKTLGTFSENIPFAIGEFQQNVNGRSTSPDPDFATITPALHSIYDNNYWRTPKSLDEVLMKMIEGMDEALYDYEVDFKDAYDPFLYKKMKDELTQKKEEILHSFITVKWFLRSTLYSGRFGCWEFKFDQDNGEYYHSEETGSLDY